MRNKIRMTQVQDIRELLVKEATIVQENDSADKVINMLLENPISRHVYVVNNAGIMVGSIRMNNIIEYIFPFETVWLQQKYDKYLDIFYRETAGELMIKDFVFVKNETTIGEMVTIMDKAVINELPVLDENGKIIGEVNFLEVLRFMQNRKESENNK